MKTALTTLLLSTLCAGASAAQAASVPSERAAPPIVERQAPRASDGLLNRPAPEVLQSGATLHIAARSAETFEMSPAAGSMLLIALDGHGVDLDIVVTRGERTIASSLDASATPVAFFRAPGGRLTIDVINASDRATDYTWHVATLENRETPVITVVSDAR